MIKCRVEVATYFTDLEMIVIGKGNDVLESLEQFGGLGLSYRSFSTCSNDSITNSVKGAVFQNFKKGE